MISIRSAFEESAALTAAACNSSPYLAAVEGAVAAILKAFQSGLKLLVFGNGGSSADAQHILTLITASSACHIPG
jgi:phosphoheptose isomerase